MQTTSLLGRGTCRHLVVISLKVSMTNQLILTTPSTPQDQGQESVDQPGTLKEMRSHQTLVLAQV
jgi:hypothetical protein